MVITYFFRRILMFLAVLFICPFVAYGAETCSAGQMLVDGACVEPAFTITTTDMAAESTFSFQMSASGVFYVDFDDGRGVQKIDRTDNTKNTKYTSAAYANAGTHIIKMYGKAKEYSTSAGTAAISFSGNTNIVTLGGSLGAIFGGSAENMFDYTFYGCTSLKEIPDTLFSGVKGSAEWMFSNTFFGCTSLQSIPANLFSGVTGSASRMFTSTFAECTSLKEIPDTLFSDVNGSAESMFSYTFRGCTSLKKIPATLFSGVNGSAENMFYQTFYGCTSLESLPSGLFKNIKGKPADNMFLKTFYGCSDLSGYIPSDMFENLDSTDYTSGPMTDIFAETNLDTTCPAGTYQYITGFESDWSGKVSCTETCPSGMTAVDGVCTKVDCAENQMIIDGACVEPAFTITTTEMVANDVFSFKLSAKGKYFIDWGDGEVQPISKTNVSQEIISHEYKNADMRSFTIRFAGIAETYSTAEIAAISFESNPYIQELQGSLGAIFNGSSTYLFANTFKDCKNLNTVSSTLFNGVTSVVKSMFNSTFHGCTSLTNVPSNLFDLFEGNNYEAAQQMFMETFRGSGITTVASGLFGNVSVGAKGLFENTFRECSNLTTIESDVFGDIVVPVENMFGGTFWDCISLENIASDLFKNISGGANKLFYSTFRNTAIKEIPSDLFAGINTNAPHLFDRTFYGCSNLESIPNDLFDGITTTENADSMFIATFYGCSALKNLPDRVFANIQGEPSTKMFDQTFKNCTGFIDAYIPVNFFAGLVRAEDMAPSSVMSEIFSGTSLLQKCPAGTYKYITEFSSAWSGKVSCTETCPSGMTAIDGVCTKVDCAENQMIIDGACVEPAFTITTTNMAAGTVFDFSISASGVFYVDFDDGRGVQKIDRTDDFESTTYTSAAYANTGTHTIKMYGEATGYNGYNGAISFSGNKNIVTLGGSLGKIFRGSAENMFNSTFSGCTKLETISETLFSDVSGSATSMFNSTFYGCTSLREIPNKLFSNFTIGKNFMFSYTFYDCENLEAIPEDLFSSFKDSDISSWSVTQYGMFQHTFQGCSSLKSIPGNLFSSFTILDNLMFLSTFQGCTSLKSIPENLFSSFNRFNINENFSYTFSGCTSLESLPDGLFKNIEGKPKNKMFYNTFSGCSSLSGYIPSDMFEKMDSTDYTSGPMANIFNRTNLDTVCPAGTYQYITGFESDWSGKVSCTETCPSDMTAIDGVCTKVDCAENQMIIDGACVEPAFTITTTNMAAESTFSFQMSASGVFYVDFDDGRGVQKIDRTNNTIKTTYTSAAYANAGTHIIKMYGRATGYSTYNMTAAISFSGNTNIATLGGSLGAIFGGSTKNMFYQTFYGCTSLQKIPEKLFEGVKGSAAYMFFYTFNGCTSLQSIPEYLFAGITGSAECMFQQTFYGCTSLQSIPGNLFEGVNGSASDMFFQTFYGCTSLKSIQGNPFANVTGSAEGMFRQTFQGCTSLQEIPGNLFDGVTGSAVRMFSSTFRNCTTLKSLPKGLFKNIEGRPADNAFNGTFSGCSSLSGYIPSDMFEKMDSTDYTSGPMANIFNSTNLDTVCPAGTAKYITGFESDWSGKVSCAQCPDGICSINKPCSPSANTTGETTCQYNANTGDYSDCDECKIIVTCNPGQYLPAGASKCAACLAGRYCIGNTAYMYNPNKDQGLSGYCGGDSYSSAGASKCSGCPYVTDPYGGLFVDVYSDGGHDSIDTCVATYEYLPEYMVELLGITVQEAIDMLGYNPDSDANKRGLFAAQCHYDTVTQQYTKDCAGQIAMCEGGYYTNAEINEEVGGLPYLEASTLEEILNTSCVPAEPGYWSPGLPHTDLENITQEELSLTWVRNACPAGTTSAAGASDISHCVGGRTLHIGDDITMNLTTERPTTPRVMVFQVLDELYYGGLSDTEKTINKNTDKKFRIFFDNKDYWLHDYTVE